MLSDAHLDFPVDLRVASIRAPTLYRAYPKLEQAALIPDAALTALNEQWSHESLKPPAVEIHVLRDVYVLAEGMVFDKDGRLFSRTKTAHAEDERIEATTRLALILSEGTAVPTREKAILCKQRGSENYGHWLVEMLPKAFLVQQELSLQDWPVVVHETAAPMLSTARQSLALMGYGDEQILVTDRSPAFFRELVVISGLTVHSVYISPLVMECMDFIAAQVQAGASRHIYVPRRPSVARDFEDEPAVAASLRRAGYDEVVAAELKFTEQVAIFRGAERVVGVMGAALCNTIFCRPGTRIVMFCPATARELLYWNIAEGRRLDYHEIRCEEVGPQRAPLPWDRNLRLTPAGVLAALDGISRQTYAAQFDQVAISSDDLAESSWTFRFSAEPSVAYTVRLERSGGMTGYPAAQGWRWQVCDGVLEILDERGACLWRFDDRGIRGGTVCLRARYRLDPERRLILVIERNTQVPLTFTGQVHKKLGNDGVKSPVMPSEMSAAAGDEVHGTALPDHAGVDYLQLLAMFHQQFAPRAYLEIGTREGHSLALAHCASVAIDPQFVLTTDVIGGKPLCLMFQGTSDAYFRLHRPERAIGHNIDFAFLDGLHLFEVLLRDFINTEKNCYSNSVIAMHDCLPTDIYIAERIDDSERRRQMGSKPMWWTGDVWKIIPVLRQYRPDLQLIAFDCVPTGLVFAANLDPSSNCLIDNYDEIVAQYLDVTLATYGLSRLHREVGVTRADLQKLPFLPWQMPTEHRA